MENIKMEMNPGPFVLASILTSYPGNEFQGSLRELLEDETILLPRELQCVLLGLFDDGGAVENLRSEYISIFDHSKSLNPLYETEYGRERAMFKATELSDIAGFYKAFGFEMDQDAQRDMVDHVSVELEFYSLMMMKKMYLNEMLDRDGCNIVEDGMRKFMESHLGRFVPAILNREGVQSSPTYRLIFDWVSKIVFEECTRVGAAPESATWLNSQSEKEEVCCGGSVKMT